MVNDKAAAGSSYQKQFFAVELDRHDTQDANKEGRDCIARSRNPKRQSSP